MAEVANLSVSINADTRDLEAGLSRAKQHVSGAGSAIQSALGAVAVGAVAGLGAAFVGSVKSAADFEKQMSAVGAVAGASQSEMKALTATALQLGKDTSFSASEAAVGIEELVKAGVSIADVMGGGARAALDLAAAGAISVGDAAEIASNAMNVFNLKGADMAHVADVIAGAANASAIGVNDYKFSLAAAGAVAATVGISFESLSQAIAVMGNAGIKGSDAGTSLKTMLLNLQPTTDKQVSLFRDLGLLTEDTAAGYQNLVARGLQPAGTSYRELSQTIKDHLGLNADISKWSKKEVEAFDAMSMSVGLTSNAFFDAGGNAKDMAGIAQVLQDKLGGMTRAQQLATLEVMFGSDAIRAGAVLLDAGAAGFTEMAEAMGKVTAQGVANERLNNLWGSIEKLKGSLETAAIILGGQFTPALKRMADAATEHANTLIDVFEQIPDAIETVKQALAGEWAPDASIRPFTLAVGEAALALNAQFGPAVETVGTFISGTLAPAFQAIAAPLAAFSAGFLGTVAVAGLVTAAIGAVTVALGFLLSPLGLVAIAVGLLAAAWTTNFMGIQQTTAAMWAAIQPVLMQLVDWLGVQIPPVLNWISTVGWPAMVTAGQAVSTWITGAAIPAITQLVDWLGPKIQEVTTWITGTGWPALVTAGTAVGVMVTQVTAFFTALFVELEKRGVFEQLGAIWNTLVSIGGRVWDILSKIAAVLATVFEAVAKVVAAALLPTLVTLFGSLGEKATAAGGPIGIVAAGIDSMAKAAAGALGILDKMLITLQRMSEIRMPSLTMPGGMPGGGGGSGAGEPGTQSFTPLRNIETMNTAALYAPGVAAATRTGSVAQVNQMKLGLSNAEALAACGPAALDWFRQQMGRNPDAAEAMRLAKAAGWTAARGMAGPGSFSAAAAAAGIPNRLLNEPSDADIDRLARGGQPFALSTGEHYYQVQGGSAAGLNVGASGTVLGGGAATMSAAQIRGRGYPIQAAIVPDIPAPPPPPPTAAPGRPPGQRLPGDMDKALTGGAPGAFPEQWPGFMAETWEQLPQYLQALETIQGRGAETFVSVLDAGVAAGGALVSASTDSLGNVTRIYSDASGVIGATITSAAGVIVNTWGAMAVAVPLQTETMVQAALFSVTNLGTGILTTMTEASGTTVATVTSLTGQVTSQIAQMANGVVLDTAMMGAGVLVAATQMHDGVITSVQDMSGNVVVTVTDMQGNVTSQYTTMAASAATMSQQTVQEFGEVVSAAEAVPVAVAAMNDSFKNIKPPNLSAVVKEFERVEKAAKQAWEAGQKIGEGMAGGKKSGSGGDSGLGKRAMGGPVDIGETYLVGERGPELFTPSRSGAIIANRSIGSGGTVVYLTVQGTLVHERELPALIATSLGQALRDGVPIG